jgi:integrase
MFFLIATYGLRASEVVSLTLDAIDWRRRLLSVASRERGTALLLPLTDDAGATLVRYLPSSLRQRPAGGSAGSRTKRSSQPRDAGRARAIGRCLRERPIEGALTPTPQVVDEVGTASVERLPNRNTNLLAT